LLISKCAAFAKGVGVILISFEGGEGAGKTTQIQLLAEYLWGRNLPVLTVRDPGGTPIAEKIREILKDKENIAITAKAEALLYLAARNQMVETLVRPGLKEGMIVICDRFTDSTMVYQGYANGLDLKDLEYLSDFATSGLVPDLTFILQISPKDGLARKSAQGALDRTEAKGLEFHRLVAAGYQYLANEDAKSGSGRIISIDATLPACEIHGIIVAQVDRILNV
jgi:dTMP kinase